MESNRLREQLLDAVGQALIATDLDGRITYWNQAAERLYGWAADEVLGRDMLDVTPAQISREQAAEMMEILRAGKSWTGEFIVSHRDGTSFPVKVTRTPIVDDNGAMIGMLGLSTDITERRWAEAVLAVLQENETRFRSVVESLPTALVMVDQSGTITLVNKQVETWFGYNQEELIGQPVDRLVPEPVRDQHQAERDDYLRAPAARKMGIGRDLYARRKDGSTFPVEIGLTPVEMVDGSRILATVVDITERKQAEERLKAMQKALLQSEQWHRALIQQTYDGILLFDDEGIISYASPAVTRITGYNMEDLLGEAVQGFVLEEDLPAEDAKVQALIDEPGGHLITEHRLWHKDGSEIWVEATLTNLLHHPDVGAFVSNFRDVTERKRTEQVRRQLAAIVETSNDAIIGKTLDGTITSWNAGATRLYGYTEEEALGKSIRFLVPLDRIDELSEIFKRLRSGEHIRHFETERVSKEGRRIVVSLTISPMKDEQGTIVGASAIARDVTLHKEAEQALKESNMRFANLGANLPGLIYQFVLDEDGSMHIPYASSGSMELLGLTPEAFQDVSILIAKIVRPGDYERFIASIHQSAQTMEAWQFEGSALVEGSVKWIQGISRPRRQTNGSILWDGLLIDITDRKQAEEELRESESRYRFALEAGRMGTWEWDVQAGKMHWSDYMRELFGMEPGQFDGRLETVRAGIHPEDRPLARSELQRVLAGGGEYHLEFRVLRPDGTIRWLNSHGRVRYDEEGKPQHVAGIVMDITERKMAETQVRRLNKELEARVRERTAQLVAANQELEAFSYSVSHDLRAPLRTIDGFSRILLDTFADELDAQAQHYLQRIRRNTLHMGQLVDDLLQFSRLNRQSLRKREVEPRPLVEEVLGDLASVQEGRDVQVEIGPLPPCEADPTLLQQVYVNLLGNAIKYTRPCKTAHIKVGARQGDEREVPIYYVADNGVGFDMRYAHKLFGVFQRLHRAEDFEGTGVGLALVQRIIHRHGGEVWAEAAPNQGATFYFTLTQGYSHEG